MALVRKTEKLKLEINDSLDTLTKAKIASQLQTSGVQTSMSELAESLVNNGHVYDLRCLEHFQKMKQHDSTGYLDLDRNLDTIKAGFNLVNQEGKQIKTLACEIFKFTTGSIVLPRLKQRSPLLALEFPMIQILIGKGHLTDLELVTQFSFSVNDENEEIQVENAIGKLFPLFRQVAGIRQPLDHEKLDSRELRLIAEMEAFRVKTQKAVQRLHAVRTYIMGTLWNACSSLNAMTKPFPGILEYLSDETVARYHKNAPRNASLDPTLMPDAAVLAATAEAKLKR